MAVVLVALGYLALGWVLGYALGFYLAAKAHKAGKL